MRTHEDGMTTVPPWLVSFMRSIDYQLGRHEQGQAHIAGMIERQIERQDRQMSELWDGVKTNRDNIARLETRIEERTGKWGARLRDAISPGEVLGLVVVAALGLVGILDASDIKAILIGWLR